MQNISLIFLVVLIFIGCNRSKEIRITKGYSDNPKKVEIEQLIENIKQLDRQYIETSGIFVYEYENIGIYKTRFDVYKQNSKEALWLEFENDLLTEKEINYINNKRVKIRGFISLRKGHLMQFSGSLTNVNYIEF